MARHPLLAGAGVLGTLLAAFIAVPLIAALVGGLFMDPAMGGVYIPNLGAQLLLAVGAVGGAALLWIPAQRGLLWSAAGFVLLALPVFYRFPWVLTSEAGMFALALFAVVAALVVAGAAMPGRGRGAHGQGS